MDRIVLVNISKRAEVFNLAHQIYCKGSGECRCQWQELKLFPSERKGAVRRSKKVRVCDAITVLSRQESPPLAPSVLELPEVKSAMTARPRRMIVKQTQNGG